MVGWLQKRGCFICKTISPATIDQNHLLTIGQNTPGGAIGPTQVSLFDISDLTQPLRIAEYTFERQLQLPPKNTITREKIRTVGKTLVTEA
jgi:hypothetical protein